MRVKSVSRSGFTLIEMMLVSSIIGLLAAIAIPKFSSLVIRAKEASVRGKLGSMRSAITIYYADNEGLYPDFGSPIPPLNGKYVDSIPFISIPTVAIHFNCNRLLGTVFDAGWATGFPNPCAWTFYRSSGTLLVNCTHADSSGRIWSTW